MHPTEQLSRELNSKLEAILQEYGIKNTPQSKSLINALASEVQNHIASSFADLHPFDYRTIFDGSNEAMFIAQNNNDGSFSYIRINSKYKQLLNINQSNAKGSNPKQVLGDTLGTKVEDGCTQCIQQQKTIINIEEKHSETSIEFWSNSFTPVWIEGSYKLIIGLIENITERVQAERALKESEERFRSLYENSTVGIYRTTYDGKILMANPTLVRMLGYSSFDELTQRNLDQEGYEPGYSRESFINQIQLNDEVHGIEASWTLKDGSSIFVLESAKLIRDKDGTPLYFDGIVEDITERRKTELALERSEEKLREQNDQYKRLNDTLTQSNIRFVATNKELGRAREEAEKSDQLKTAFLTNMSHEIRTPMNAIIGFSEMLLNPNLVNEKRDTFTRMLNSSCHTLLSVIDGVIDISKIETGQIEISNNITNINTIISRLQAIYSPQANQKGINISSSLPLPNDQADTRTDPTKLTQILTNLINNAIKFTDEGEITVGYRTKPSTIEFFVKDTGIGISPSNHHLIFDRFRQVEESDTRRYGGTGLGLAICKAFANIMEGDIWVDSDLGKGSTFWFSLPYKPSPETEVETTEEKYIDPNEFDFSGYTIIIAEDEEANYLFLKEILNPTRVNILHATSGVKAIDMFRDTPWIDLILMDIKMPDLNGIEATRAIKALRANVPIVAITAFALGGDKERCLNAGCDSYLSKPINSEELLSIMAKHLSIVN